VPGERRRSIRCAIYTRKSSEEGLEQSFNSLDAQREACVSYIESQRHEGWKVLAVQYDDGGYSGGSMERPALKQLLADIEAKKIDTVVVYKVDRLTRSLTDFAKIVEIFDAHGVSFVSITQHFNTTTSMGRLTLNVLLSFAQFEREVTGERIRDKIAASKKKGMWMGGAVPLGYDVRDKMLCINPSEAKLVCQIYRRYVALGSVTRLKAELDAKRIKSKTRVSGSGNKTGGAKFSRGALYRILSNRIYLGEVAHQSHIYPGLHEPIVPKDLWEKTQAVLDANTQGRRNGVHAVAPSLLAGLLYDEHGNRMTPHHTVKNGKRYRYYVSQAVIQGRVDTAGQVQRIPAHDIESVVLHRLTETLGSQRKVLDALAQPEDKGAIQKTLVTSAKHQISGWARCAPAEIRAFLLSVIQRITVQAESMEIRVSKYQLRTALLGKQSASATSLPSNPDTADPEDHLRLIVNARLLRRRNGELRLILAGAKQNEMPARQDPALIKAIARGHQWYEKLVSGKASSVRALAVELGLNKRYVARVVQCALLAPDIVEKILEGRQPPELTLSRIFEYLPTSWSEQRQLFSTSAT
jgi:DNA invertase Pin-like site-specific DNA recombinase